jgi:hypothetical protein
MDLLAIRSTPILEQLDASNQNHFEPYYVGISSSADSEAGSPGLVQWVVPEFTSSVQTDSQIHHQFRQSSLFKIERGWQVGARVLMVRHR